jgi:anti-anti-sigma factor
VYAECTAMLLQIDTKRIEPDITVLVISGKIALGRESQKLETMVQDLLREGHKKIILDLSSVDHMDSTGIGIIAYCFGTLNRLNGDLRIAGATGKVLHLLQMTHLDKVMPMYSSAKSASQDMSKASAAL